MRISWSNGISSLIARLIIFFTGKFPSIRRFWTKLETSRVRIMSPCANSTHSQTPLFIQTVNSVHWPSIWLKDLEKRKTFTFEFILPNDWLVFPLAPWIRMHWIRLSNCRHWYPVFFWIFVKGVEGFPRKMLLAKLSRKTFCSSDETSMMKFERFWVLTADSSERNV